jgi:hypothetical protein
MTAEEIATWRKTHLPRTTDDVQKAEEEAKLALDVAPEAPPPAEENLMLPIGPPGSDEQRDYEMICKYVTPVEKPWVGGRPGWGELEVGRIDQWDLCRLPKPEPAPGGFNLTTAKMPTIPAATLIEATHRLERSLAVLERLGIIEPGRSTGSWRFFFGRSSGIGSCLEKDPQSAVASRKGPVSRSGR